MLDMVCSLRFVLNPKRMTLNFNSDWNWSQVYTVENLPTGILLQVLPALNGTRKKKKKIREMIPIQFYYSWKLTKFTALSNYSLGKSSKETFTAEV